MNPNILIIDDFASVRLYHTSFLKRKGYHCVGAASGAEALELLRTQAFDLVLLDMVMPEMTGDAFVACLDADPRLAGLPVLVITSEEALALEAFKGARRPLGILAKPVLPAALLQCVQKFLPTAVAAS